MTHKTNIDKSAIDLFDASASQYQDMYMDVSAYQESLDQFCHLIAEENDEILDIACGPGNVTRYLLDKRPNFKILGIDLSPKMLELAKTNNSNARFRLMDTRDISKLDTQYHGIMCSFCLPYLSKEESLKLIRDAYQLLKPNGVLYLSTMEDAHDKSGFKGPSGGGTEQMYMYYHEEGYLTHELDRNGFTEVSVHKLKTTSEEGIQTTDMILIARK